MHLTFKSGVLLFLLTLLPGALEAVTIGHTDDFEDGTTQGWLVGLLGAPHPAPPVNVSSGGPGGIDDNYLLLTSVGGAAAGSRLSAINIGGQWAGDYVSAGVQVIRVSLNNVGASDLHIRLLLEDPQAGPPADVALTGAVLAPAGSGWMTAQFSLAPADLILLQGDLNVLLAGVTALRIMHNPDPSNPGPSVVAKLGVDDITAAQVPEAGSGSLLAAGVALLAMRGAATSSRRPSGPECEHLPR